MIVSAPSSGLRMIKPVTALNAGSHSRTPLVSAQPGCIAWTTIPRDASFSAHSSVITTSSRLVRA